MARETVAADLLAHLRTFDTPTICNGLEEALQNGLPLNCTTRPLFCADPKLPPIVGYARTATIRARVRTSLPPDQALEKRLSYYEHVAAAPHPTVTVIEDLDEPAVQGAWWGEVHTTVHQGLGSLGVVTNGSIRDLDAAAPGFQMIAGGTSPSHGFVHVVSIACRVDIHGMVVAPGDLIHADRHGAVVIPLAIAADLPAAIARVAAREKLVIDAARKPGFSVAVLREAMRKGKDIH